MIASLKRRWAEEAGYKQLLGVAFPLILSMGSHSVMMFVDRMFLSWYSPDALAAAVPAGILNFALICFFLGLTTYASTFVAQYVGAKRPERVGPSVWQGVYVALCGGILVPMTGPFAPQIFAFIGHAPEVQELEVPYFRILNFFSFFFLANAALSCFYSGRGRTWTIMWTNFLMTAINMVLDYGLIFGKFGLPEMGMAGAGLATLISAAIITILYVSLVCSPKNHQAFQTRTSWRYEKKLFLRLLKFGAPSGAQFFLDVMGFTIFVFLVGRIGKAELAASNVVMNINLLGLLPMIGLGIATSILVGQYQGAQKSEMANKTTYSSLHLAILYSIGMAGIYLILPGPLTAPFAQNFEGQAAEDLFTTTAVLLRFFALIIFFDAIAIMTSSALKGAGDTRFVMIVLGITSVFILIIPSYVAIEIFNVSVTFAWGCATFNLACVAATFFFRFRSGLWKRFEVIER